MGPANPESALPSHRRQVIKYSLARMSEGYFRQQLSAASSLHGHFSSRSQNCTVPVLAAAWETMAVLKFLFLGTSLHCVLQVPKPFVVAPTFRSNRPSSEHQWILNFIFMHLLNINLDVGMPNRTMLK